MKEPPKFIQICSSKDQAYLLYGLTADGEVFGLGVDEKILHEKSKIVRLWKKVITNE